MSEEFHLSDRLVRRGLRMNIMAGCLGTMWGAVALNMPYTMLLDALGANGVLQGLSSTLIQLMLVAQIPGAIFVESLRRRKPAWGALAIVHRVIWFIPACVAWVHPHPPIGAHIVVAISAISMCFGNLPAAAWHSWMADLIPESSRGRFWSTRQMWVMVCFLVTMAGAGCVLDLIKPATPDGPLRGFALVFMLTAILGVADIVIHLGVPEPPPKRTPREHSLITRLIAPLHYPNFRRLGIAIGVWTFSCTLVGAFGQLYAKHVLHASYRELSAWSIASAIGTILASLGLGYLIDRLGARAVGAVMVVLAPAVGGLAWFLVTDTPLHLTLPLIGAVQTSWGVAVITVSSFLCAGLYSGVGLAHLSLLAVTAPERGRTLAMAVQWTMVGLISAGGPMLGGFIMDSFPKDGLSFCLLRNTHFHFIHALIILQVSIAWFIVLPILLRVRVAHERLTMIEAFNRIVLVNPLRFASGIYHARIMASPVTHARRARAVEAAGDVHAEVAIADLTARLADPSSDVREAAAQSLGRIGTSEAIDALVRTLQEPGGDLAVPVLRALYVCADRRATAAVLARLRDENIEAVREAARTLGAVGDPAAAPALSDLLHTTRNDAIALAASEALGRLGDVTAVYEILPRMRQAANPLMRRALAASIGDLLGEPDGFYRILTEEEHSHGAGITPLIKRLAADLRRRATPDQRAKTDAAVAALDRHYEARDLRPCVTAAYQLTGMLARRRHGVVDTGNARLFLAELNERDARFAVGAWYLAVLNGAFQRPDASLALGAVRELEEVQLAIYILGSWSRELGRHPPAAPETPTSVSP